MGHKKSILGEGMRRKKKEFGGRKWGTRNKHLG